MTVRSKVQRVLQQEQLNFLLTNRLPRRLATNFMGWFSQIEQPLVRRASIRAWRYFADVDLSDAADTRFRSLHEAFTRSLRPGARPVDRTPDLLVSPCDAIVGACGKTDDGRAFQIKGAPYRVRDLLGHNADDTAFRNGRFITLRLTAGMYHRFHAPHDMTVEGVTYISGDTWNVNPIALKRVKNLFCRNERAVIRGTLNPQGKPILIVPVAAILVAGIRLHFLDTPDLIKREQRTVACSVKLSRGDEMGWFEHGSTIIMFAPDGCELFENIQTGRIVRAGEPLLRL